MSLPDQERHEQRLAEQAAVPADVEPSPVDLGDDRDASPAAAAAAAREKSEEEGQHPKAKPEDRPEQLAKVDVLAEAMKHELLCNAHKGDWTEQDIGPEGAAFEVIYHACKLALAMRRGDKAAALEFAGDVGNGALMCADVAGALDTALLSDPPTLGYGNAGLRNYVAGFLHRLGPEGRLIEDGDVPF